MPETAAIPWQTLHGACTHFMNKRTEISLQPAQSPAKPVFLRLFFYLQENFFILSPLSFLQRWFYHTPARFYIRCQYSTKTILCPA